MCIPSNPHHALGLTPCLAPPLSSCLIKGPSGVQRITGEGTWLNPCPLIPFYRKTAL